MYTATERPPGRPGGHDNQEYSSQSNRCNLLGAQGRAQQSNKNGKASRYHQAKRTTPVKRGPIKNPPILPANDKKTICLIPKARPLSPPFSSLALQQRGDSKLAQSSISLHSVKAREARSCSWWTCIVRGPLHLLKRPRRLEWRSTSNERYNCGR
jgi:hypothetical protein